MRKKEINEIVRERERGGRRGLGSHLFLMFVFLFVDDGTVVVFMGFSR